jgi:hypothetical protein
MAASVDEKSQGKVFGGDALVTERGVASDDSDLRGEEEVAPAEACLDSRRRPMAESTGARLMTGQSKSERPIRRPLAVICSPLNSAPPDAVREQILPIGGSASP